MRILLLQSSSYIPSLGGANKANRLLLEQLAAQGHDCHVVGTAGDGGATAFRHAGVQVEAVRDGAQLRAHAAARLRELAPDRVLVSSEDPAQILLEEAVQASPHAVYLAHTTLHLPFGPDGFLESPGRTALLGRAAGIVAVSGYIRDYIRRWAGLESTLLRFPVYGAGPFPELGDFDRGFVTLINPCAVKGISIFLELARRLPEVAFAAVPTWGTTVEDREALAALPNVRILPPAANVDEIFAQTRVLLAPSLWGEAFGQVAVEAMLRGIPVLASDAGGLPEAKLGVDYVLPVRSIRRYKERFDERKIPVAVVPEQDLGPWEETLRRVLGDRDLYTRLSRESRQAAHEFVAGLGTGPFTDYLEGLPARTSTGRRMKILLVQPLDYLFTPGGAHKANRLLLQGLAARGHVCRVVAPHSAEETVFLEEGVEVHAVAGGLELRSEAVRQIRSFDPDWTIVSEDLSGEILQAVLEASPSRVVYLAHSPATLPFGPSAFAADEAKTALLRRTAGILTVSRAMQDYLRRWAGLDSTVVYSPAYGSGPFPALAAFDRGYVAMINPSGIKGLSIFAGLARRMPGVAFAAVPTWSTTADDRGLVAGLPNVTLLEAAEDVNEIYAQVRVLLVPSLWGEAFGQVVIEALLRGIPVVTSDQGGLPEAGLGVTRIVPVRPIERYEDRLDDRRMPVPIVPEQSLDPWEAELRALLSDRAEYERLSEASRRAAARFVSGLGIEPYERFLAGLAPASPAPAAAPPAADVRQKLAGLSPEKLELLARRLKKKEGAAPAPAPGVPRLPRQGTPEGDRFPLSFAQRRLWFLDRFEPGGLTYNEHFAIRLSGPLEVRFLAAALDRIVRRHEVLRTTYAEGPEEPVQVAHPPQPDRLPMPFADLAALPDAARRAEAARLATAESRRPFDLAKGPVMRSLLLSLGAGEHLLVITAHHIAVDNWSATVLFAELTAVYGALSEKTAPVLPELPVQYADFAAWQRAWLTGATLEEQIGFWRGQLAGAPAVTGLPTDRPRPALQSFRGNRLAARFSPRLAEALRAFARKRDATPYMLLLAACQTLLHRVTGQDDVVVGTPVAGRTRREIEPLIGCFLNLLPLRALLKPGLSFEELLDQVRRTALDAFAHQDLPFERLVEALAPERSLSHPPLFQVLFNFLNVPPRTEKLYGGARLTAVPVQTGTTRFDLELYLEEQEQGLIVALVHNTDLFDAATMARLIGHLETLLTGVAARPDSALAELPLLTVAESHQLLSEWNDTAAESQDGSGVHQLFAAQARRTPHAPAAAFEGIEITYAELADRAGRLARHLRALGCGPETRVGIALERSLDVPAALLGVLEAGAAYVPLDPGYPRERLALVLEDAAPRVLITEERLLAGLPPFHGTVLCLDREPAIGGPDAPAPFHGLQLAYVLYTSGSTGRPKGVAVSHASLVNFLAAMRRAPGFAPGERLLAVTSLSFDIAALEIFLPLTTGGSVELASREEAGDGLRLAARLRASGAGAMQATPATWRMLFESRWTGDRRLRALCGGEPLPERLAADLRERTAEVWNLYGPTETTVWSSAERLSGSGPVSIGRPIARTEIRIVDAQGVPVPIGVPGELLIGGAGLARGYLGRPDLTAERFVPDGLGGAPGARLYRTGDLARLRPDGRLEHLGRLDHQVKVRGFRVELGEIEHALAAHPGVGQAVVVVRSDQGVAHLVAWFVPAEGADPAPADLREHLRRTLPDSMIPGAFVALPELPLTPNRKIDRGALMRREIGRPAASPGAAPLAPRGPLEETLAGIWRKVLGVERIGIHESFFEAGGHSLRLVQVQSGILDALGVEVPIVELFRHPTIAALASYLGKGPAAAALPPAAAPKPEETDIAIIGMAARLPGAPDLDRFWQNLKDGVESIARLTDEQLRAAGVDPEDPSRPGLVRAEPLLEGIDRFDERFFGFNPREAQALDPQQRVFLELAWACVESAGYDPERYPDRIGVFAGEGFGAYILNLLANPGVREALDPLLLQTSIEKDYLATRTAYKLGLRGPGVTVQTACSTSLVAVHMARQSLILGECEMALAGGVTLRLPQGRGYVYQEGGIASPDGHCRTFDAQARGAVFGSGAGVVLLKRLADALRDGDTVHAVLKGSAINNDGSLKVGYTAPSVDGQAAVIAAAHRAAKVSPDSITYVEAHGTATPLGDPIEVAALTQAFRRGTGRTGFCALGSVKTNIGHVDAAAGVAGLIKTALALKHRQIPPSLHFEAPNPQIDFANSPFYVNTRLADWTAGSSPRRAGVSSFGIGGTNAHAVLEEAPPEAPSGPSRRLQLLLLSARTPGALEQATRNLADFFDEHPDASLPDVAWTLQAGRKAFEHRRMLVCEGVEDAIAALGDPGGSGRVLTRWQETGRRAVAFLFPGQGAQHPGMGRDLYEDEPVFRNEIDACAERLLPLLGCDLREILFSTAERHDELQQTRFVQPALFAVELALARLWISWGLRPEAMIGHSLGEYVAACLAGVFSPEDALELVAARGVLMQELPSGAMLSVELSEAELAIELAAVPGLSLAAVNAPSRCVVSGPEEAVSILEARLAEKDVQRKRLRTSHAFHSAMMDPVLEAFAERVARVPRRPPEIPFLSNLTGTWITAEEATDPGYWARHLRETVRFAQGLTTLLASSRAALLEAGPGSTLADLARRQSDPAERPAPISSLPRPGAPETGSAALLGALGRLWLGGVDVDWQAFHSGERLRRVPLPTYPFERRRFWIDSAPSLLAAEPAPSEETDSRYARPGIATPYREPGTETERRVAALWETLLGIDQVGVHDDFFELGGHSLLATRLASRLREAFGREIPLETVFAAPTVEALARALDDDPLAGDGLQPPPLRPVPRTGELPLSFAQERLWFLDRLQPESPFYNLPVALELRGALSLPLLAASLDRIIDRHEALRTTFRLSEDRPVQEIAPALRLAPPRVDLDGLPEGLRSAEALHLVREEALRPFDLTRGPLVRATVLRLEKDVHVALFNQHHIVSDGWSLGLLIQELTLGYRALQAGEPPSLPDLPVQYADYAVWQREWLQGEVLEERLRWWRERLAGAPHVLQLPTDRPRPAVQSLRGARQDFALSGGLTAALHELSRRQGATLFMTLAALVSALLSRHTGAEDLLLGSPIAGRDRAETERLIGIFVNTLVLRAGMAGDPAFSEILGRMREMTLGAYAHQDLPFEKLVDSLQPERSLAHTPLFQVLLVLQNAPLGTLELPGLTLAPLPAERGTARFDLLLSAREEDGRLLGDLEHNRDLFDPATIARLLGHLRTLAEGAASRPETRLSELPLLSEPEVHQLRREWNDTAVPRPAGALLHELFASRAAVAPHAPAVVCEDRTLTYAELDRITDRLASRLRGRGVGPDVAVGVLMERSVEMVVALLGILKAGGAYLPLDPEYPGERLAGMVEEARVPVLLAQERLLPALPPVEAQVLLLDAGWDGAGADGPGAALPGLPAESLAYILYTSGSTGRPKGVMIPHRGIVNRLLWMQETYGLTQDDRVLQKTPFGFDVSVWEFFWPLITGACLVVASPGGHRDPAYLAGLIERERVTVTHFVPSMLQVFLDQPGLSACASLRLVVASGEALSPELRRRFRERLPARLENLYGPTEASVDVTAWNCDEEARGGVVPIGRPVANTSIHLLDRSWRPVPIGVAGELCIGGVQLARGYCQRPDLTAERFVPGAAGGRLYRTGDLARHLPDGAIEYLGRIDHQVKIRGFRVELGEIEAALLSQSGVKDAVVVAREVAGARSLVAYVVLEALRPAAAELREALRERLPEAMVPAFFVVLPELPLTPNGKVDRRALPAPEREVSGVEPAGPRTPVEEVVASLWAELLGLERVGIHESFFDLGGHSLLATRVVSRLRGVFGVELPLRTVFERTSVAQLSAAVEEARRRGEALAAPPLVPVPREGDLPVSFGQQRLWFLAQLEPGSPLYNIPGALRMVGPLNPSALEASFDRIVARHESLRTTFHLEGEQLVQRVAPPGPWHLPQVDLRALPEERRRSEAGRLAAGEARHAFDLALGPLLRTTLLRLEEDEHALLLVLHHIVSDGWSVGVLIRELTALYPALAAGLPSPLPPLPLQYPDFAVWQRSWLQGEILERELAFWREQLAGAPAVLELPTDRPRPPVSTFRGEERERLLPPELGRAVRTLARREGATPFMVLLATLGALLARGSGQPEVMVASAIANRNREETEGLIGFFVNTLALRVRTPETAAFGAMLAAVRETTLSAYAHQDLPFEKLISALDLPRELSVNPLCQVMLTYQNLPPAAPQLPGLEVAPLSAGAIETGTAKFDLTLFVREVNDGLAASLEFNADLFDAPAAERILNRLEVLLSEAASRPQTPISDLPLLSGSERHQILVEWNDTAARYPELLGLHELVEVQATCTPDAPAVLFAEQRLTYRELNARAATLARSLRDLGCGPDVAVGVLMERSVEMVVALLGILKAGGAYLAIDPEHPSERIAWMLSESRAPIVLTQEALLSRLPVHDAAILCLEDGWGQGTEETPDLPSGTTAASLAYILYTSGSTGRPKGVMIPHRGIVNRLLWMQETYGLTPHDRVLQKTPFGFDVSVWEFFWPLITGACLVVASPGRHRDPAYLAGLIERERVTVTHFVPSMLQVFLDQPGLSGCASLRLVVASGEALSPELRRRFRERLSARLENLYGPTEASVDVTAWNCDEEARGGVVPIGRPVANTSIHLLDRSWRPVPIGVAGELCIGGVQLARGYCQRPDLTAERFVPGAAGGRLYRTGDLARHLPDGAIEYLGRIDHQVKIRGFRIELGEIEAALLSQSGVKDAVVVARQDGASPRLVAYVVFDEEVSPESLREGLLARLPQYMVPSAFVVLPALPLNRNGKIDRKALPEPEAPSGGPAHAEPRTPVEQVLAALWAEVLRVEKVGRHDNFFALGGDSILSVQISTRAQKAGVRITPRLLFQHQTVAELAAVANTTAAVEAEQGIVTGPAPLTPIQRWFFADDPAEPHHFNQAVLFETERRLDPGLLQAVLDRLEQHHDALRLRFFRDPDGGWRQVAGAPGGAALTVIDLTELPASARPWAVEAAAAEAQASFDLERGPLGRALWIDFGPHEPGRFFWALHHLVVDGVSWRILLEDLAALYDGVEPSAKTTSFRQWAERLATLAPEDELPFWLEQPWSAVAPLPLDHPEGSGAASWESSVSLQLDAEETRALLQEVPRAYNTRINDVLLAALASGLRDWTGSPVLLVDLEGHGREEIFPDVDLSRTVGWFTTLYPVVLDLREASGPGACLKTVKEQLRRIPRGGLGHGLLREAPALAGLPRPEVVFNYLGQLDQALPAGSPFRPARESRGPLHSPLRRRSHLFSFDGSVFGGRLGFTCTFSTSLHRRETVERLVHAVAGRLREILDHCRALETRGYTPSDFPLANLEAGQLDALAAAQDAIEDVYPLSPMQQGMLFHTLFAPQTYVLQISGRILGDFDREAFLAAWARLLDRHPILRTSFHWEGLPQPLQVVHRRVEIPLEWLDLSDLPESDRRERLDGALRQDLARGFQLGQAPLLRLLLFKEAGQEHRLVWSTHLILMDGWSQATVLREIFEIYAALREGREPELPATPPYRDYIAWLTRQQPQEAEEFWRRELDGLEGTTPLPADRGPGSPPEILQDRIQLSLETTAALQALGRGSRLTLNTLLQGAWALLLARTSGNPEVLFGATVSGRPADLPGTESMVGLFINSLPVRVAASPQARLLDWLSELQDRQTTARQYDHVPLVDIQGWSPVPRGTPLFESLLVFENYPAEEALSDGGPGLQLDEVDSHEVTHYPLVLVAVPGPQLTLKLFWDRSRFSAESTQRLLLELTAICEAMARRPEASLAEIDPLPEWERHQILVEWNDTAARYPELLGLHELVEVQATCTPDAPAVLFAEQRLTYRELNARAAALAHSLRHLGCGPDVAVGVLMERSVEMVVALLGILKAGGAYLAIDPEHPSERIAWMLAESRAPIVIAQEALLPRLPAHEAAILCLEDGWGQNAGEVPDSPGDTTAESLAYILYTSGSTGRPKGVMIPHRGIVNRLLWMQETYGLNPGDRVLQKTPFGFDVSVWEFFWPLITGACLVVANPGGHRDPAYLAGLIERERITVTHFVPSMLQVFLDQPGLSGCASLRLVVASGEALSPELRRRFRERLPARLENLYGPTEASVDVTAWNCDEEARGGVVPIGRPVANTAIHLLDRSFQPVPIGVAGELCIGGVQLARGYCQRPDLTAERFVPGAAGGRLYRTGDLARHLPDGAIEYLGRIDHQVKIRGFRIELGEIEAALAGQPGVREAVVVARQDGPSPQLVAYVVAGEGEEIFTESLREGLLARLPQHMVPAAFVVLPAMPLNRNGKIDRKALAKIVPGPHTGPIEERGSAEPQGHVERTVAAVWCEILGLEQVGRHQSFFDLGGHSLLLVRVQGRLAQELGREISLVDLFRYPTVSALAGFLEPEAAAPALATRRRALPAGTQRIAVIGMAGRFPGASGVDAFWQNLATGVESISFHTDADLEADGVEPTVRSSPHFVPAGGVLEDIDLFDASFFGYTPRDAEIADPQHRLFLECAWQALESAGYVPGALPGPVGVFAGVSRSNYLWNLISSPEILQAVGAYKVGLATDKDFLTTNVSYKLDLKGPSLSVQTACSTSLVAVHVACRSLLAGECDMALAGGASIALPQRSGYVYQEGGIHSPDGHCRAFDARAQGTVAGSGVGVVLLKRLDDALADGDPIHAVILGSAINNDGSGKVGYTAPSVDGQAQVIRAALEAGGVDPKTVRYVEAHGTGTPLGDPIEVAALTQAFREAGAEEPGFCALGSVKTNIGHLDAASGVAGLIKTVLALQHRQIPPSLHFKASNPQIDFTASPFYVNARLADWTAGPAPRRAGVSSFGIGGTNAHAVLEEAPPEAPTGPSRRHQILLLSARTPGALEQATGNLADFLAAHPDASLPDVAWTLQIGRKVFEHRRMLVCEGVEDAIAALRDPAGSGRVLTRRQEMERRSVAFLFPGQGAQHPGMGRDLYEDEPVFRNEIDACALRLLPLLGRDLREILFPSAERRDEAARELQQTRFAQPALFAVELALARLWISWGLRPEAMIGHSLGEYVAATLAGVFSPEDALELVAARGALMQKLPPGAMLSVELSEAELAAELEAVPGLSLAAVNAPNRCVVSGPEAAVSILEARLAEKGVQRRRLHTSHAFHSAMMDPVLEAFAERVARVPRRPPEIPFLSNLTGTWVTAVQATDPGYWARHLRETVRFAQGLATLLAGFRAALLEVGPGSTLADLARRQSDPAERPAPISSLPRPGAPETGSAALLGALGRLWLAGVDVDWQAFHASERRRLALPTYPFERQRYWVEAPRFGLAGLPVVDRRRFVVVGGEAAVRHEVGFADPRIAEAIERLLLLEPRIRVVLPLEPEARISLEPGEPAVRTEPLAGHQRPDLPTPWQAPGNEQERQIVKVWEELLGISGIGIHDDFFALGGDSLLATRLASRLRDTLGREVPMELLFAEPTVARLAARLEAEELPAPQLPPIERAPRGGLLPLSFAQQRLLFLHMLAPGDVSYNMPLGLRLKGPLEPARLHRALRLLVARHEVLRTTFSFSDREPVQRIGPAGADELPLLDLSGLPGALSEREALRSAAQGVLQPFDLLSGPVLRAMLLRLEPEEHVLVTDIHHIAVDGWSWAVFSREMVELYEKGEAAELPELPVQYADFAVWQRRWLQGEALAHQLEYWRQRLAGLTPVELPADHPRPPVRSGRGAALPVALERGPVEGLRLLGQQEDATLFMALLAVFSALVHQRTKKDRLVLGTDIANRTRAELEDLIGLFVNQLVLSFDLSGNPTFREILRQVRRDTLEAYRHQDAPFDRLVELLRPERDVSRTPLFQLKLVLQNTPSEAQHLPDLSLGHLDLPQRTAKFDLLLNLVETGNGISGFAEYSTDLFEASTIARLLDDFALVLTTVVEHPDLRLREIEAELGRLELRDEEQRDRERRSLSLARARRRARVAQPVATPAAVTDNGDL